MLRINNLPLATWVAPEKTPDSLDSIMRNYQKIGFKWFKTLAEYGFGGILADEMGLVKEFNEGDANIFLISLKAGGTGLNLTGADVVIHFDPWWNPAVEEQATDRAHRIGQEKSVEVIKLLAKGTIEEKIYKMKQRKKEMIKNVMGENMNEENIITQMTQEDLESLFV